MWIRTFTPRLFRVAAAFASEETEPEDILQEVWIIAASRAHRRPTDSPLGAWLHAITLNCGRAHLRRRRRREWLRLLYRDELRPSSPTERLLANDTPDDAPLWRAIAALPSLQRDIVLLRIVDELSTRETAARLGRAEGTVKASLHRALHTLRRTLGTIGTSAWPADTNTSAQLNSPFSTANPDG